MSQSELSRQWVEPVSIDDERLELIGTKASEIEGYGNDYRDSTETERVFRAFRNIAPLVPISLIFIVASDTKMEPHHTRDDLIVDGVMAAYALMLSVSGEIGRRMARSHGHKIAQKTSELVAQPPSIPLPGWARRELEADP